MHFRSTGCDSPRFGLAVRFRPATFLFVIAVVSASQAYGQDACVSAVFDPIRNLTMRLDKNGELCGAPRNAQGQLVQARQVDGSMLRRADAFCRSCFGEPDSNAIRYSSNSACKQSVTNPLTREVHAVRFAAYPVDRCEIMSPALIEASANRLWDIVDEAHKIDIHWKRIDAWDQNSVSRGWRLVEEGLTIQPGNRTLLGHACTFLTILGDTRAAEHCRASFEMTPTVDNRQAAATYAERLHGFGRFKEAIEHLDWALQGPRGQLRPVRPIDFELGFTELRAKAAFSLDVNDGAEQFAKTLEFPKPNREFLALASFAQGRYGQALGHAESAGDIGNGPSFRLLMLSQLRDHETVLDLVDRRSVEFSPGSLESRVFAFHQFPDRVPDLSEMLQPILALRARRAARPDSDWRALTDLFIEQAEQAITRLRNDLDGTRFLLNRNGAAIGSTLMGRRHVSSVIAALHHFVGMAHNEKGEADKAVRSFASALEWHDRTMRMPNINPFMFSYGGSSEFFLNEFLGYWIPTEYGAALIAAKRPDEAKKVLLPAAERNFVPARRLLERN